MLLAALFLSAVVGHWEGTLQADKTLAVAFDLAKDAQGQLIGTITVPAMNVKSLPLSNIVAHDNDVSFEVRGSGAFHGTLSADGQTLEGTFTGGMEIPFTVKRTGDAQITPPEKSGAVGKNFEGDWIGSLKAENTTKNVGLRLTNHADGTATGIVTSSEGIEFPITSIKQNGAKLTFAVASAGGSYDGALQNDGTIAGTWTQGSFNGALNFHRNSPLDRWANAIGGRDKIASVRALYREATIDVSGVSGTIKVWHTADGKYRKEEHIGPFSTLETFDGTNGVVQQGDALPHRMTPAEVELNTSKAYANSNAIFFAFAPQPKGSIDTESDGTIVLRPTGGIDWHIALDPQTSLPATMIHKEGERTVTVTFVSYETVDGMQFEKEIRRTMGDPRFNAVIRFTKTVVNPTVDTALFAQAR